MKSAVCINKSTETITYAYSEEGILFVEYAENITLDVDSAEKNHELLKSFIYELPTPLKILTTVGNNFEITNEARLTTRDYNKEMEHLVSKQAIVCKSYLSRVLGYIYMKMLNPSYESKFFPTEEKALEWLRA